jgi:hypothetical protein
MRPLSRRDFLRAGMVGAGALALGGILEACGSAPNVTTASTFGKLLTAREATGDTSGLQVEMGGQDYVAAGANYVVLFLVNPGKNGTRIFGDDLRVWISPTQDPNAAVKPTGPIPAPFYRYAHPDGPAPLPQGLNAALLTFPSPGIYTVVAETTTGKHLIGTTYLQANAPGHTNTLIVGQKAYASQTPTVANNEGVNPICTRTPPCDMHQITLASAITNGKPTAFIIATPEFCQSRNCGPTLDELITVQGELGEQVNFVHSEVYVNDQTADTPNPVTTPTFNQWGVQSEPWLFVIDRNGIIQARFEGGFTAPTARAALQPLLA